MLSNKVKLTAKDILEKEFKTSMRGYNQEEVDQFLDLVIKDYETFHQAIEELQKENLRLKMKLEKASKVESPSMSRLQTQPASQPQPAVTNYDILKRLSNLEKHVFGDKLYED
ncbi:MULTISPECIES: cell division regulator GpsB [Bacillus]|jgi:DivIVA domain-containing protein|uniref:Cell cycle protein GpsB n=1 Tax=Bacillus smithii 7_3_47FAA TaxID=665952 RepID=G9QP15_9BACI|nr:cell division regulator GpsB [Bacillus smithii]AKP47528.1 Cell division protein GpsB [Bacillus smithii]EHL74271.1 DivIVA domain-containing protein [Bacillus smithii 7_3_47FAA]MED0659732.1 cell division regulator GpsB [Bacillus smithii]MED1420086.1 cell division regulator GpsB [Bacillus smithii]MED1455586.1 cell division regulator GpsB [Bacillus smithii]